MEAESSLANSNLVRREESLSELQASPGGDPAKKVRLDARFITLGWNELFDAVIRVVSKHETQLANWPEDAKLILTITGDRGNYKDDDTRQAYASLEWPIQGQMLKKRVHLSNLIETSQFEEALEKELNLLHELRKLL